MYNKKDFAGLKRIMIAFILIFTCLHVNVYGQDVIDISLEQPGTLKKVLKKLGKKDPLSITHLKITGDINSKDVELLNQMTNLVHFDASEMKGYHYYDHLDLSLFKKLNHLSLSTVDSDVLKGKISSPLTSLTVSEGRYHLNIDYLGDFIDKVYITVKDESEIPADLRFELHGSLKKSTVANYTHGEYSTRENERIKVDTLYLPNIKSFFCDALSNFDPYYVVLQAENQVILNRWKATDSQSTINLKGISYIMPFAFNNINNIERIECPESIKEIFDYAFSGCKNLKEVDLINIESVGRNAFEKTNVVDIVLPNTLKELSEYAFRESSLDKVEFLGKYPPSITQNKDDHSNWYNKSSYWPDYMGDIEFCIPENTLSSYSLGHWKKVVLIEKGTNTTFEITLETPGTMEKHLSDEIIANARTLTVKGILYDSDFEVLKKCKNIQTLDLSNSFICKSPETIENEEAEQAFIRGMLGYVTKITLEDSEKQYKEGKIDVGQHVSTNLLADAVKEALNKTGNKTITSNPNCIIPISGFDEWRFIKRIKLPLLLENVSGMGGCNFLEKVVIPEGVKRINNMAFYKCRNLKEINFPSSLEYIGKEAFFQCVALSNMNLNKTKIEEIDEIFGYSPSEKDKVKLNTFHAPKGLKLFKGIPDIDIAYFYTREEPFKYSIDLRYYVKELHIPTGSRAGWDHISKDVEKVLDDIQ